MQTSSDLPDYIIHSSEKICGFFKEYRFLSNFYTCLNGIWYEGLKYQTVEHAYQCAKFPSEERINLITLNVKQIKRAGNSINLPLDWEHNKFNIMYQLVAQKFCNHHNLREELISTGNKYLEERNNWGDLYWGTNENGIGDNKLGKILMNIRSVWL